MIGRGAPRTLCSRLLLLVAGLLFGLPARAGADPRRHSPTADFTMTPASGPPPLVVQVDGSASVPSHGSIVSWSWDWGDGSPADSGVTSSHTYAATGTYTVTLTVLDSGAPGEPVTAGTLSKNVHCRTAANSAPTARITNAAPLLGETPLAVSFTGLGEDAAPAGDRLEHRWDFGDGSPPLVFTGMVPGSVSTPTHTYTAAGFFFCVFRVTDAERVWEEVQVTVNPSAPGTPHAVIRATPVSGPPPLAVTVDGSSSFDSRGAIVSHVWDWGDRTTSTGPRASHTYPNVGTYTITLTVTNTSGVQNAASQDVSAVPPGKLVPSAHILSAVPAEARAPASITFLGHGHGDLATLDHEWNFGDGSPPQVIRGVSTHSNTRPSHLYSTPGLYACTLRVRDGMNLSAAKTLSVQVSEPGSDRLGGRCGGTGGEALVAYLLFRLCRRNRSRS